MIIAVDFDGVLQNDKGEPNTQLIRHLQRMQGQGCTIILWTCREGKTLSEAISFLRSFRFAPNFVNCNAPEIVKKRGYDSRKIYADLYIDDKCASLNYMRGNIG